MCHCHFRLCTDGTEVPCRPMNETLSSLGDWFTEPSGTDDGTNTLALVIAVLCVLSELLPLSERCQANGVLDGIARGVGYLLRSECVRSRMTPQLERAISRMIILPPRGGGAPVVAAPAGTAAS
jgi:hypothetical protein